MAITSANQLELLQTAEAVAREKMIDAELVIQAMEDSLARAAKSRYGAEMDMRVKIDRKTGKVSYRPDILAAKIGDTVQACPGIYGGHNWQASAYSPPAGLLVVPLHQLCSDMVGRQVDMALGAGGYGGDSRTYEMPSANGRLTLPRSS